MNEPVWTKEMIARAAQLRQKHMTYGRIGQMLGGKSAQSVSRQLEKHFEMPPSASDLYAPVSTPESRRVDDYLLRLHASRKQDGIPKRAATFADQASDRTKNLGLAATYRFVSALWRAHGSTSLADTDVPFEERHENTLTYGDGGTLIWSPDEQSRRPYASHVWET